jgi:hypothetical protein
MNQFDNPNSSPIYSLERMFSIKKVTDQMQEDGISWPRVSVHLRKWALREPDIQRVTLGYIGGSYSQYSLAVLLNSISSEGIRKVIEQVTNISRLFNEHRVLAYPLGPNQSNSILLNSAGYHKVYQRV